MGLLDKSVPVDFQGEVFDPGRRPTMEGGIDQWLQHMPDLAPARADRLPQRPRVLRAEHWAVGIVVDRDVLGAPPQKQRKTVGEQKTHHHAEARGPGGDRANRRLRPVECTYHHAHLSAAAEPMLHGRLCLYVGVVYHALPSIAMKTRVNIPMGQKSRNSWLISRPLTRFDSHVFDPASEPERAVLLVELPAHRTAAVESNIEPFVEPDHECR